MSTAPSSLYKFFSSSFDSGVFLWWLFKKKETQRIERRGVKLEVLKCGLASVMVLSFLKTLGGVCVSVALGGGIRGICNKRKQ